MLPESALSGLSAEDFRLILCGCAHIDIDVLRSITIFDDESRKLYVCMCLKSGLVTWLQNPSRLPV